MPDLHGVKKSKKKEKVSASFFFFFLDLDLPAQKATLCRRYEVAQTQRVSEAVC